MGLAAAIGSAGEGAFTGPLVGSSCGTAAGAPDATWTLGASAGGVAVAAGSGLGGALVTVGAETFASAAVEVLDAEGCVGSSFSSS